VLCLHHTRRGSNTTTACASSGLQVQRLRSALRCCSSRATAPQTTLAPQVRSQPPPRQHSRRPALQRHRRWHGPPCSGSELGAQALYRRVLGHSRW